MTDITTLLAEALDDGWPTHTEGSGSIPPSGTDTSWEVQDPALPSRGLAAAILATPAGQTLARQAATGAAVERLDADHRVITWEVGSGYEDAFVADVSLFVGENFGPGAVRVPFRGDVS